MTLQLLRGHDTAEAGNDDDGDDCDGDEDDADDDDNDVDDVLPTSEGYDVAMNDAMQ